MPAEPTQQQSNEQQKLARELSLAKTRPPTEVPGYEIEKFLGSGAYGEVWVGFDRKTGRRVAIKFYTHRGGVDWSLLSREVEKLVFLSADRYVVQLLDVGWDAEPPYYVMEYIENGSLDDWLTQHGPLPVTQAVELFREVATGLMHAHGRGVLHCDLKPANVLLDQDRRPRLADFGQSRLTHEQAPSLGTLFYMAPEQADLNAVPDARWDVYALGAMLYCTLTGSPPHRSDAALDEVETAEDLPERLARYRQLIVSAPPPAGHRKIPGMDRTLAELIDNCLAADPKKRFSNVQAVLDALNARDRLRARRPLMILGFIGPLLLLLIMALFGGRGFNRAKIDSDAALTLRAQEKNHFAAKAVAGAAAETLQRYFRAVERVVEDPEVIELLAESQRPGSPLASLLQQLRDPNQNNTSLEPRDILVRHQDRAELQQKFQKLLDDEWVANASSWFITDAKGTQVAAAFADAEKGFDNTVGKNYGYRTYFHGGPNDLMRRDELGNVTMFLPPEDQHIREIHLSAPFFSTATSKWKVAVSAPVYRDNQFLGIVALTVNLGVFVDFEESGEHFFATLVDGREGNNEGMILQHPLFDKALLTMRKLPDHFAKVRVNVDHLENGGEQKYYDPLVDAGSRRFIAATEPVVVELRSADGTRLMMDTGLKVIVQEDYLAAVAPVRDLGRRLLREGLLALAIVVVVILAMWGIVMRAMRETQVTVATVPGRMEPTPVHDRSTVAAPRRRL